MPTVPKTDDQCLGSEESPHETLVRADGAHRPDFSRSLDHRDHECVRYDDDRDNCEYYNGDIEYYTNNVDGLTVRAGRFLPVAGFGFNPIR